MFAGHLPNALTDQINIIFDNGKSSRLATHGLDLRCQHKRVVFENVASLELTTYRNQFCPSWQDCNSGFFCNTDFLMTSGGNRTQIHWPQYMTRRQHQLSCNNILTQRPDVTPWG